MKGAGREDLAGDVHQHKDLCLTWRAGHWTSTLRLEMSGWMCLADNSDKAPRPRGEIRGLTP